MLLLAVFAAFAAMPVVIAQNVTSSVTSCTTSFGMDPLTTGTVETYWAWPFATTVNVVNITSTSCSTVFATASVSTITDVMMSTIVVEVTATSSPPPTTIPTPAGFLPLLAFNPAGPTATGAISRLKRYEIEGRDAHHALQMLKRQTPANNTAGFIVDRYGHTSNLRRRHPRQVNCRVSVRINSTSTVVVNGGTETMWATGGAMATAMSTSFVTSTTTFTAVMPRRTVYAACQPNNIVNSVQGTTGESLIFDRVIYRPTAGWPMANELITNTTTAENCCIACQRTPYCAGSFWVPSNTECHLRLTQPPTSSNHSTLAARQISDGNSTLSLGSEDTNPYGFNGTSWPDVFIFNGTTFINGVPSNSTNTTSYPTGTNSDSPRLPFPIPYSTAPSYPLATGTSPSTPLSTATPNTCSKGSLSQYLGTIQGQTDFPIKYALSMSNGPCGRYSVWPVPVNETLDTSLTDPGMAIGMGKRSIRLTL